MAGMVNYFFGIKAAFLCLGFLNLAGVLVMGLLSIDEPPKKSATGTNDSWQLIRGFIVLCVCMMLGGVAYRGVTVILPSYFELKDPALLMLWPRMVARFQKRGCNGTFIACLRHWNAGTICGGGCRKNQNRVRLISCFT